jgi:hypothetical protein
MAAGMTPDRFIGPCLSADGVGRPVHEDAAGRQYALSPDDEPVYGQWLTPADEPVVVEEGQRP